MCILPMCGLQVHYLLMCGSRNMWILLKCVLLIYCNSGEALPFNYSQVAARKQTASSKQASSIKSIKDLQRANQSCCIRYAARHATNLRHILAAYQHRCSHEICLKAAPCLACLPSRQNHKAAPETTFPKPKAAPSEDSYVKRTDLQPQDHEFLWHVVGAPTCSRVEIFWVASNLVKNLASLWRPFNPGFPQKRAHTHTHHTPHMFLENAVPT